MKLSTRALQSSAVVALALSGALNNAQAQSNGSQVETVTVTANRLQAQEVKRQAPNVIEVQPYTEIRKLPDVNIAEALQRIPGISMEADTGEGRFINIRGMDADLNGTTFDGVVLTASNQSSPQSGGRAVAFDAFPSAIVGGVEVIKSLTPDMDATGLGGVVNLVPRQPATNGNSYLDVGIGGGLEPQRDRPRWQTDATASTTFDVPGHEGSDRFSFVGTLAFDEDWRGIDDLEEGYVNDIDATMPNTSKIFDNVQYRWYEYHRTRRGAGTLFTFSPDANNTFYVRALYAGYSEHAEKQHLEIHNMGDFATDTLGTQFTPEPDANGNYFAPNGVPFQTLTDTDENVSNTIFVVGGHSLFGQLKADYKVSWTRGQDDFPRSWGAAFAFPDSVTGPDGTPGSTPVTYNNITSANFPTYNAGSVNLSDPANYVLGPGSSNSGLSNGPSKSFESQWAGAVDFTLPLELFEQDGSFKFGGMVRKLIRGVSSININYTLPADVSLAGLVNGAPHVYYDNHYNIGPSLNALAIETLPGLVATVQDNVTGFEHDDENVYAGYLMYTTNFGPLGVLAGVRFEATDAQYQANLATTDPLGNTVITPNTNKANYTNFFPSLQTKYTIDDQTQLRAAFSTAIARPGFNQITAAKSIDYSSPPDISISTGNPSLKPTTGKSIDLTAEHYMPEGGLITVGVFYKYFSNYIIPTTERIPNTANGLTLPPGFNAGTTTIGSFQNIGDAFNEGVEASYTQKFAFLPDPLDGLGFDGNVTYNHARGAIRVGERHQLPQDSPFNFNAALFYEKGPLSIRVGASYVSENIFAVGSDPGQDVYSQPRFRLDLGTTYDICNNVQIYFNAKNLTDTLLEFTQTNDKFYPIQREFYGPTFFFGVRVRLGEGSESPEFKPGGDDD